MADIIMVTDEKQKQKILEGNKKVYEKQAEIEASGAKSCFGVVENNGKFTGMDEDVD